MIKASLDTIVLLIVIVAVLVCVSQWGVPAMSDRLQTLLVKAAEVK